MKKDPRDCVPKGTAPLMIGPFVPHGDCSESNGKPWWKPEIHVSVEDMQKIVDTNEKLVKELKNGKF